MPVLVKDTAEAVASADVKVGGGGQFWDWGGQRTQWPGVGYSLVRPMGIAELLELTQSVHQVPLVPDQGPVKQLAAADLHPPTPTARVRTRPARRLARAARRRTGQSVCAAVRRAGNGTKRARTGKASGYTHR